MGTLNLHFLPSLSGIPDQPGRSTVDGCPSPVVISLTLHHLNFVGQRQLVLQGLQVAAIENKAVLTDSFDNIDLSDNALSSFSGELSFALLSAVYLGRNHIIKVASSVAKACLNLRTLIYSIQSRQPQCARAGAFQVARGAVAALQPDRQGLRDARLPAVLPAGAARHKIPSRDRRGA